MRFLTWLGRPRVARWAPALGALLTLSSVPSGLAIDDHILRTAAIGHPAVPGTPRPAHDLFSFIDGHPGRTEEVVERIAGAWTVPLELRLNFFRPVTSLTHAADYRWWPNRAWAMHAQNLAWYAALVALVGVYYRRLMSPAWMAGAAVMLYALDDAHGVTVGWISNRNALVAGAFGVIALICQDRATRDCWRPGLWWGPVALLLSLLSAEAGIATGGYLVAHALFLSGGRWSDRLRVLAPYGVIVVGWRLAYTAAGRGALGADMYIDPGREPAVFAAALAERLPALLLAQVAIPPADVWSVLPPTGRVGLALAGALVVATIGLASWPLLRASSTSRFWVFGAILAAIPSCATFPSDRLLVFVGIGVFGFVVQWCAHVTGPSSRRSIAVALLVGLHAVVAPLALPLRALTTAGVERSMARIDASLPLDAALGAQQLVIVTAPDVVLSVYVLLRRASLQEVLPRSVRILAMTDARVDVTRDDARTVTLRLDHGLFRRPIDRLLRSRRQPFRVGDVVRLEGFEATVLAIDRDGPTRVRVRFDRALEDGRYRWVAWGEGRYEPFVPPGVGQTVTLHRRGGGAEP